MENYPEGELPQVTFFAADETTNQLVGEFVKAQAKDVLGIDIEVQIVDGAAYQEAFNASDFQLTYASWAADYPDPDNWLPELFGTDASANFFGYSSAEADDLIEQAAAETDTEARTELYGDLQRVVVVDDAVMAPLYHPGTFHLVKPQLMRFKQHPLDSAIPGTTATPRCTWPASTDSPRGD